MTLRADVKKDPRGRKPRVAESSFLDPTAQVIGDVVIGDEVFVGPGAVIRADEPGSTIVIGDRCNVQDRVIIHALEGSTVKLGPETSLAHGCIVHGPCEIGAGCFVGFGSVVFKASLGDGTFVGHLAVVEGVEISAGRRVGPGCIVDSPEKAGKLGICGEEEREFVGKVVGMNLLLLRGYREMAEG
ncbi:MAG: carbonate dehydratase [Actinobacteria bacterium]|nr:carbonate dehydratase [Actinomycetota bacterium]